MHYFFRFVANCARAELAASGDDVFGQLIAWLNSYGNRFRKSVFVACFSEAGNQLSQWRGYTKYGKGMSLGFSLPYLEQCAERGGFNILCVNYSKEEAMSSAANFVQNLHRQAQNYLPPEGWPKGQEFDQLFYDNEDELLRLAVSFKNERYEEEREWRVVSDAIHTHGLADGVKFREGNHYLIPYKELDMGKPIQVERFIFGPTPYENEASISLAMFLSNQEICTTDGPGWRTSSSGLPYRE